MEVEYIEISDEEFIKQYLNNDEFQNNEYTRKLYQNAIINIKNKNILA